MFGTGEWRSMIARFWYGDNVRRLWLLTGEMSPDQAQVAQQEIMRTITKHQAWHLLGWVTSARRILSKDIWYNEVLDDHTRYHILNVPVSAEFPMEGPVHDYICHCLYRRAITGIGHRMPVPFIRENIKGAAWISDFIRHGRTLSAPTGERIHAQITTVQGAWTLHMGWTSVFPSYTCSHARFDEQSYNPRDKRKRGFLSIMHSMGLDLPWKGTWNYHDDRFSHDGAWLVHDPTRFDGEKVIISGFYPPDVLFVYEDGDEKSITQDELARRLYDLGLNAARPMTRHEAPLNPRWHPELHL